MLFVPRSALGGAGLVLATAFAPALALALAWADTPGTIPAAAIGPLPGSTPPAGAVFVPVGAVIQDVIDRHPPGTVYVLQAGLHRLQGIVPKHGDTILGEPGATLNGARLLSAFARRGDLFVAAGQQPHPGSRRHGECRPEFPRCDHPQDLYIDGRPLRAVATLADMRPGAWHLDLATGQVSIAEDPAGRKVELSYLPFAIGGAARNVMVRNLVIENYAAGNQEGAINHRGAGVGWLVANNEVRWNHGYGIKLGAGNRAQANKIHHNGQLGIGGGTTSGLRVQGNEIAFNAWNGTNCEWECGGAKWGKVRDLVVSGNWVHDNGGVGLWTDESSSDVVIEANRIEHNQLAGISHEVSHDAVIRRNVLCGNGKDTFRWGWQAQIQVQNSTNTQVYGNQVVLDPAAGGNGITVIEQDRGSRHASRGVHVHDNSITMPEGRGVVAGWFADHNAATFKRNDNRFDRNTYHLPADRLDGRFWMANEPADFDAWRAWGEDLGGATSAVTAGTGCPTRAE